jgi:hypothetical protein
MAQQFKNNARALLTASITNTATTIVVEATKADLFPVANVGTGSLPSTSDWFKVTLQDSSGNVEIVAVRTRTAGSGILSNVIRGYDGTTALAFVSGTVAGLRITAEDVQEALDLPNANSVFTGDNSFSGTNEFTGTQTFSGVTSFSDSTEFNDDVTFNDGATGNLTGNVTGNVTGNLTGNVTGNLTGNVTGNVTGNAGTVTNGVYTTGNQTIGGEKTFSSPVYLSDGGMMFNSDVGRDTGFNWASDGVMNVRSNGATIGQFNGSGFTGNAATATTATTALNGFGIGQNWVDPGRSSGTWYQNTTIKPIMVFARWGTFFGDVNFYVNPSAPDYSGSVQIPFGDGDSDAGSFGVIVVPPNQYYTCDNWGVARELRS